MYLFVSRQFSRLRIWGAARVRVCYSLCYCVLLWGCVTPWPQAWYIPGSAEWASASGPRPITYSTILRIHISFDSKWNSQYSQQNPHYPGKTYQRMWLELICPIDEELIKEKLQSLLQAFPLVSPRPLGWSLIPTVEPPGPSRTSVGSNISKDFPPQVKQTKFNFQIVLNG